MVVVVGVGFLCSIGGSAPVNSYAKVKPGV